MRYFLDCEDPARKFLLHLDPKRYKQVAVRIFLLQDDPRPHDSEALRGYPGHFRIDQGEYRIVYRMDTARATITIRRVGKRNDDEVYRGL